MSSDGPRAVPGGRIVGDDRCERVRECTPATLSRAATARASPLGPSGSGGAGRMAGWRGQSRVRADEEARAGDASTPESTIVGPRPEPPQRDEPPAGLPSCAGPPTRRTVPASPASRERGFRSASRSSAGRAGGCRSRRRGCARRARSCRAARWGGRTGRIRAPYMCTRPPRVAPHISPCWRLRTFRLPVAPTRANVDGRPPPVAAITRRNRVHDPARDRLDHPPR